MGRLFVLPHEAAIAEDIGTEYSGELTLQYPPIASRLSCRVLMDVKDCFKRHAVLRGGVGCPRAFARERRRKSLRVDPSMERALKRNRTGQGPLGMTNRKERKRSAPSSAFEEGQGTQSSRHCRVGGDTRGWHYPHPTRDLPSKSRVGLSRLAGASSRARGRGD